MTAVAGLSEAGKKSIYRECQSPGPLLHPGDIFSIRQPRADSNESHHPSQAPQQSLRFGPSRRGWKNESTPQP